MTHAVARSEQTLRSGDSAALFQAAEDIRRIWIMAVPNKELRGIDLTVARGERIVIAGPSGAGKTTLIRCIKRLETHQQGRIEVDGIELNSSMKNIGQVRAEVGMCFQQFNLFPHMTILEYCTRSLLWRPPSMNAQGCFSIRFWGTETA